MSPNHSGPHRPVRCSCCQRVINRVRIERYFCSRTCLMLYYGRLDAIIDGFLGEENDYRKNPNGHYGLAWNGDRD